LHFSISIQLKTLHEPNNVLANNLHRARRLADHDRQMTNATTFNQLGKEFRAFFIQQTTKYKPKTHEG